MMKLCEDGHPPIVYSPEDWPMYRGRCPYCSVYTKWQLNVALQSLKEAVHDVRT